MSSKKENLQFNAQTDKVLRMVINSVYTKKEVFLRELVSNAVDAIEKRKYLVITQSESLAPENGEYEITIVIDKNKKTVSVTDNGIGMSKEEMINNLGTIAKSGTEDFVKDLDKKADFIGQFGVGFYSAFIVGSSVTVVSKKAGSTVGYVWESDGTSGYTMRECFDPCEEGTTVTVHLQEGAEEFLDKFKLKFIIETYSNSFGVPIKIISGSEVEKIDSKPPIWARDRKTISSEDYGSFYKSLSHLPDKPMVTIHYNGEGALEFKSLLFIPSMQPFNLFHPDRQTRVKLYSKRVFITEDQVQILPKYLRFIYGVVEFDDVPLNISRETVQVHGDIQKIERILVKKVFSELENWRKRDPEEYRLFWKNFGNVMKEGLCEGGTDKDVILNNCLFYTTKRTKEPISLADFIKSGQGDGKEIYYCVGDSIDAALENPQLEAFIKQDLEVLLLVDPVDSFWINVVHSHDGRQFKSVSRNSVLPESLKKEAKTEAQEPDGEEINKDEIVRLFKEALKGKVSDVKISDKLVESPACISVSEGSMDIAMERLLLEQNQIKAPSLKILELNHQNKLVQHAVANLRDEAKKAAGTEWANLIFETACVAQGEAIKNAGTFAKRVNGLLQELLVK